ncbi:hypothetical protein CQ018_01565 [Arthrobacter sp. MYb227]|nr:hypothetical protein CQ018_01565 [Arthrobacter sp. MYb227]
MAMAITSLTLSACTSQPQVQATQSATERQLVLAHADDATSTAVATLYQQMLESVGVKAKLGEANANPVAEVIAGKADIVVAGSTSLLEELEKTPENKQDSHTPPATGLSPQSSQSAGTATGRDKNLTADQTLKALRSLKIGELALLDSTEAHRDGVLITTASISAAKNINNLAQLPEYCSDLEFGVPEEFSASLSAELETTYSCIPARVLPVTPNDKAPVQELITNRVQVLGITSESAAIVDNGLVRLQDSEGLFSPQTLLPLITTNELGQDAIDAINKVSHALKQDDLIELNRAVTGQDSLPVEIAAADWLLERNLVGK